MKTLLLALALLQAPLTNKDVVELVRAGLSPEVVAAKVKNSKTDFDTSPKALTELKEAGVPDAVILAMLEPKAEPAKPAPPPEELDDRRGVPSDLRGAKRVYVDAGPDPENQARIESALRKANLGLELLTSPKGAEIILAFGAGRSRYLAGVSTNTEGTFSSPVYRRIETGQGTVFTVRQGRPFAVFSFADEERTVFEKKPAANFARFFIKEYKKANGLK